MEDVKKTDMIYEVQQRFDNPAVLLFMFGCSENNAKGSHEQLSRQDKMNI